MAKGRFRNAWRMAASQSRLSVVQVTATAMAAITTAILSARLTSFSSSILIVGVVSVCSALASEFYRIVLTASAEETKKVVAPILDSGSGGEDEEGTEPAASRESGPGESQAAASGDALGRAEANGEPALHPAEAATPDAAETEALPVSASGADDTTETEVLPAATAEATETAETAGTETISGTAEDHKKGSFRRQHPILYAMAHNQVVQMSLIFLIVALITVGISYGVARAQGRTEINFRPVVEQSLSEADRQAIAEEAAAKAQQQTTTQQPAEQPTQTVIQEQPATEDNSQELADLRAQNEALQGAIDDLTSRLQAEQARTDDLSARLDQLEAMLENLSSSEPAG